MSAKNVLDREFLVLRAKLLEVAAGMDRLDRADGQVDDDPRMHGLRQAMQVLLRDEPGRAEEIQQIFSRHYNETWRDEFNLQPRQVEST